MGIGVYPFTIYKILKNKTMAQTKPKRKKKKSGIFTKMQNILDVVKTNFNDLYENVKRDTRFKREERLVEQENIKKEQEERLKEGKFPIKPPTTSRGMVKDIKRKPKVGAKVTYSKKNR